VGTPQETTFIAYKWKHSDDEYPIFLYHEIDQSRCEIRRVEVFRDGRIQKADDVNELQADTILSLEPFPLLEEIADDPEGEVWLITKEEFEATWSQAVYA